MTARRRRRPTRSHAHDMLVTFLYIYDNIQRYAVCVLYSRALRAIHTWWIEQNGDKGKVFLCSWFSFFFRLVTKTHGALYTYMYVFYTLTTYDFLTFLFVWSYLMCHVLYTWSALLWWCDRHFSIFTFIFVCARS